jgi:hypothetical protein
MVEHVHHHLQLRVSRFLEGGCQRQSENRGQQNAEFKTLRPYILMSMFSPVLKVGRWMNYYLKEALSIVKYAASVQDV